MVLSLKKKLMGLLGLTIGIGGLFFGWSFTISTNYVGLAISVLCVFIGLVIVVIAFD